MALTKVTADQNLQVAGDLTVAGDVTCNGSVSLDNLKSVAVTVAAAGTSGASAADADLVGGTVLGIVPTSNQDQLVDSVVLGGDGSVTVTLAAAATADNVFAVAVLG